MDSQTPFPEETMETITKQRRVRLTPHQRAIAIKEAARLLKETKGIKYPISHFIRDVLKNVPEPHPKMQSGINKQWEWLIDGAKKLLEEESRPKQQELQLPPTPPIEINLNEEPIYLDPKGIGQLNKVSSTTVSAHIPTLFRQCIQEKPPKPQPLIFSPPKERVPKIAIIGPYSGSTATEIRNRISPSKADLTFIEPFSLRNSSARDWSKYRYVLIHKTSGHDHTEPIIKQVGSKAIKLETEGSTKLIQKLMDLLSRQ
jgi:hypothetical protein